MLYAKDAFGQRATVDEDLNVIGEEPLATFIRGRLSEVDLPSLHAGTILEAAAAVLRDIQVDSELDEEDRSAGDVPEEAVF